MDFLQRYRWEILAGISILFIFLVTRIYNILSLPIFTDEALYVRWAQIAKQDAAQRFISLTDGKQPMFIWLSVVFMRFTADPLLAARMVSVFAGMSTMVGLFLLGRLVFSKEWIGILSAGLYTIFPFALVYDRMALYDSLVGSFAVWSLFFAILLVRTLRLDVALGFGMVLGAGVLNKTSGFISAYILPLTLLLFDFVKKDRTRRLTRWVLLAGIAVFLMYAYYSVLRLSPFFYIIDEKNTIFYYPFPKDPSAIIGWLTERLKYFSGNILGLWDWFINYLTWPLIFLMAGSFVVDKKFWREKVLLVLWFLVPFVVLALIGKVLYPRFIFFMTLSLVPLAAFSLYQLRTLIKNNLLRVACYVLLVILMLRADYVILTDFAHAPIPKSDLGQYINDWPAGGGVREAVEFFANEAENGMIFIGTQGNFGLLPYALEIYLVDKPNVTIKGYWPLNDNPPEEVLQKSQEMPTYFVFYQPCIKCKETGDAPPSWKMEEILRLKKGMSENKYLTVYRIIPQ